MTQLLNALNNKITPEMEAIALKEKACQLAVDDEFGQKIRNELDKMKLEKK